MKKNEITISVLIQDKFSFNLGRYYQTVKK